MSAALIIAGLGDFFDAVGQFFGNLADIRWGALALGLLCFGTYLTIRSRAFYNVLRAAYPTEKIEFKRIWGAYIAAYGFNNVVPARGGDVIKLFLVKTSIPNSTYSAIAAAFFVEFGFDASMGVFILAFAFSQGVFPKPPDFSKLGAFDLSFFASHPRFLLFVLTALGDRRPRRLRAAEHQGEGLLGARAPGVDHHLRSQALLPRGLARPVRRLVLSLRRLLVLARGVPHRRLGQERALGPRRQRGRGRACRSPPAARASSRRSW